MLSPFSRFLNARASAQSSLSSLRLLPLNRRGPRLQYFSSAANAPDASTSKHPPPSPDFDDELDLNTDTFNFITNQHMHMNEELKGHLRGLLWQFRAPVRYAVAYGSGVFSQDLNSSEKPMVDLIFGVTYTQHWHSINLAQHRDHYSFMGSLGSAAITYVQDKVGAGVYFNPYVEVNGTLIKYGVVNLDTLCRDLTEWDTLYLAGRLQKPVKVLRDNLRVGLANQTNLLSATRVALLLLPENFSENTLYSTIAGISYLGDPRMKYYTENPNKVQNIVNSQFQHFRRLYSPFITQLPNVQFLGESISEDDPKTDTMLQQDMDPTRRGNMVRRLPKAFREKLYFQYQKKFQIPRLEFEKMVGLNEDEERMQKKQGGEFEQKIAGDGENLRKEVGGVIKSTIGWPSTTQSLKGLVTAGPVKSLKYMGEKVKKWKQAKKSTPKQGRIA